MTEPKPYIKGNEYFCIYMRVFILFKKTANKMKKQNIENGVKNIFC